MKIVRWHATERVDLPDQEDGVGMLDVRAAMEANRALLLNPGQNVSWNNFEGRVFSGFGISDVNAVGIGGNGYCRLSTGNAIMHLYEDGELKLGVVHGDDGESSQILNLSGLGDDTYDIYIRVALIDGEAENRIFWDDVGSAEIVSHESTRRVLTWQYAIVSSSASAPGNGEYMRVWQLAVASGTIGTQGDKRLFYFEGDRGYWSDGGGLTDGHEWGNGANDRNSDRASYGVHDFHKCVALIRRQLRDIISTDAYSDWYTQAPVDLETLNERVKIIEPSEAPLGWTLKNQATYPYWESDGTGNNLLIPIRMEPGYVLDEIKVKVSVAAANLQALVKTVDPDFDSPTSNPTVTTVAGPTTVGGTGMQVITFSSLATTVGGEEFAMVMITNQDNTDKVIGVRVKYTVN